MKPSIGRIVHYTLSEQDAAEICQRRKNLLIVGNSVAAGHVYPAVIVRCWGDDETSAVNLKVELDGDDSFWATSRCCGVGDGTWAWPKRD